MTDEIANENSPYLEPSPQARFYAVHRGFLELAKAMPPDKSYPIEKGLAGDTGRAINGALLRELCAHISVGNKVYCCIDHGNVFEIHRLADGDSAKTFYKYHNTEIANGVELEDKAMENMRNLLKGFKDASLEQIIKYEGIYTTKMKDQNIISYSYIQRRMGCVAAFRKAQGGSTNKIKECLKALCELNEIGLVPPFQASKTFNTTAVLYTIYKIKD